MSKRSKAEATKRFHKAQKVARERKREERKAEKATMTKELT